jgi:hypothetical protein
MLSVHIHFASRTIHGIVAIENKVDAPTHCAAYSGEVSYTSAKVIVEVAEGSPNATVKKMTQKSDKPTILNKKQKMIGKRISLKPIR